MSEQLKITVLDGKYTFQTIPGDYRIECLRYGEPWLVFEAGHKAILALMGEIDELREKYQGNGALCQCGGALQRPIGALICSKCGTRAP